MKRAESWQTAEIPGPKKALTPKTPETIALFIKRAKRPLIVAGSECIKLEVNGERYIDYIIKIAKTGNIPVVATAHTVKSFLEKGIREIFSMSAMEVADRLRDPEWKGFDGKGQYDLVLFAGMKYYFEWLILSGLKHFAPHLKTVSLDKYYQPHASWSFPNLPDKEWRETLLKIAEKLKT